MLSHKNRQVSSLIWLGFGVCMILAVIVPVGCVGGNLRQSSDNGVPNNHQSEQLAPELVGITGWINSDPLILSNLRGKVVLLDFWTYTCINCVRTLPYLNDWYRKYSDMGLVIIGVHTPEFEFEKDEENVLTATIKYMLEYPVAQDNDSATWRAYRNIFWPAKYLIDKDGFVVYTHFGEGAYRETEIKLREVLADAGYPVDGISLDVRPPPKIDSMAKSSVDYKTSQTRELYAGYERNLAAYRSRRFVPYILQENYYLEPDVKSMYRDPGVHDNHFIYIHGLWHNGQESLTHARETENLEDYLVVKFFGTSVNVVMSPGGESPYTVTVTLDGNPINPLDAGEDIRFDQDGNSYVLVDRPDMYRVVKIEVFGGHELKLSSNSANFSVFAYTFGSYKNNIGS